MFSSRVFGEEFTVLRKDNGNERDSWDGLRDGGESGFRQKTRLVAEEAVGTGLGAEVHALKRSQMNLPTRFMRTSSGPRRLT